MKQSPPRKFQIHLSTCILLSFVVGALVWGNVQVKDEGLMGISNMMHVSYSRHFSAGWPIPFFNYQKQLGSWPERIQEINGKREILHDKHQIPEKDPNPPDFSELVGQHGRQFDIRGFMVDLVCAFG